MKKVGELQIGEHVYLYSISFVYINNVLAKEDENIFKNNEIERIITDIKDDIIFLKGKYMTHRFNITNKKYNFFVCQETEDFQNCSIMVLSTKKLKHLTSEEKEEVIVEFNNLWSNIVKIMFKKTIKEAIQQNVEYYQGPIKENIKTIEVEKIKYNTEYLINRYSNYD